MSLKAAGRISIIPSTINANVYIEIHNNVPIPSIKNLFGDDEVIFQDNKASCEKAKWMKVFLRKKHIKSMTLKIYGVNLKKKSMRRLYPPKKIY